MNQWYLAAGDFGFYWAGQIRSFSWFPQMYRADMELGRSQLLTLWFEYPYRLFLKVLDGIGLSWWEIEKLVWLFVFIIGIYSSYRLAKYILKTRVSSGIASFIYIANTYFLLLFGGRQLGVALAYGLSPLVLLKFIQYIDSYGDLRFTIYDLRKVFKNGLLLALLVCFDLRLAYLVLLALLLYTLLRVIRLHRGYGGQACYGFKILNTLYLILNTLVLPITAALVVHLFWILPTILVRTGASFVGEDFTNVGMLRFLSVADFSHALSLLHPNWPENLFGKVYFLQAEFLALPLLAFGGLAWMGQARMTEDNEQGTECMGHGTMSNKQDNQDLRPTTHDLLSFFAILALFGAFLAKGTHDPFGGIFVWLFEHIPGFVMFRDPTKFYLFTALGYSVLIPYTLLQLAHVISIKYYVLSIKYKNGIHNTLYFILYTLFVVFWLFSIRAVFTGQMAGNFRPLVLTHEYVELKDIIANDVEPYRTLWVPKADKFVYSSDMHPLLTSDTLWKNASSGALLAIIESPEFFKTIQDAGARYIIIPKDLEKWIFLSDYTYDQSMRDNLIEGVVKTGLRKLPEFQELAIFENPTYTFKADIPEYVEKQEYWANVGLFISGSILILLIGWVWLHSRKSITS